jgi:hypothetical protein
MRFAIVLSSISALLIAIVSAITITVFSWIYPAPSNDGLAPSNKPPSSEMEVMKL